MDNVTPKMSLISLTFAFICVLLFGANYVIIKAAIAHIPPLLLSAERVGLMGLLMVCFVPMPTKKTWNRVIALSLTQFTLNYGLCTIGMCQADAGIASILIQLEVPFAFLLGFIFFGEKLTWQQVAGCCLAFLGSYFIFGVKTGNAFGMILITLGGFVYAVSCFQAKSLTELNAATLTAWCSLLAAPQLLFVSFFYESISYAHIQESFSYYYYILFPAISSSISFALWTKLIKTYSVSQVMPFALLIPIVGVTGGILFLHEIFTISIMIGGIVTTLGVGMILFGVNIFKGATVAEEGEEAALEGE